MTEIDTVEERALLSALFEVVRLLELQPAKWQRISFNAFVSGDNVAVDEVVVEEA